MYAISIQTLIVVVAFAICYMLFMIHKTAHHQLDIYDLVMLSTVAIIPCVFVLFPRVTNWIANIIGVTFPFVVMFGLLFVILFIFVHKLTVKSHRLESENRLIIQEISLLKQIVEQQVGKNDSKPIK